MKARSDALNKILAESLDDYKNLTSKDLYTSLGPDEFKAYFTKICTDAITFYLNFGKLIPDISITRQRIEFSTLLSIEENVGVFDCDISVIFNIQYGFVTAKVIAQYDIEFVPPKFKPYNISRSAQKSVTISPDVRNLAKAIDDAFDVISSDKGIMNIESEFNGYVSGET